MKWSRCAPKSYTKWNCNELKPNRCGASPSKPNWLKVPIARTNYAAMWAVLKIKVLRCRMVSDKEDIAHLFHNIVDNSQFIPYSLSTTPIPHSVISWFVIYALFSSSSSPFRFCVPILLLLLRSLVMYIFHFVTKSVPSIQIGAIILLVTYIVY